MIDRLKLFLQESKQEFNRVNWPTLPETVRLTSTVIIFSLLTAAFLGVLDTAFEMLLAKFLSL